MKREGAVDRKATEVVMLEQRKVPIHCSGVWFGAARREKMQPCDVKLPFAKSTLNNR